MATLGRMNLFLTSYFAKVAHLLPTISDKPLAECTIAFIPTAAAVEDMDFYVAEARQALADLGATIREVDIASADAATVAATVAAAIDAADCIYVSGGHTFYLLKQLRDSGAGSLIVKAVRQGTTYIGESAGSAVAADDCAYIRPLEDPKSFDFHSMTDFAGLSLTTTRVLPHKHNPMFESAVNQAIAAHPEVLAITDSQAVHITGSDHGSETIMVVSG